MTVNWWYVGGAVAALYIFSEEARAMVGGSRSRLSKEGVDFLAALEGFKLNPYKDSEGWATIGIGHLILPKHKFVPGQDQPITKEEALILFEEDVQRFVDGITRLVHVPLAQHELDALVSFAFTLGLGEKGFGGSTLLRQLNAGDRASVPYEMSRWDNKGSSSAIVRRRLEGQLFALGVYGRR